MPGEEERSGRSVLVERPGVGWLVAALSLVMVLLISAASLELVTCAGWKLPDPGGLESRIPAKAFLLVVALSCLSMALVAGFLLFFYRGFPPLSFRPRFLIHTAVGLAAVWLVNIAGTLLMEELDETYHGAPGEASGLTKAVIILMAVLVAPAVEELFFREMLLSRVLSNHPLSGAAATSAAFGLLHLGAGGAVLIGTLIAMGAVLAWLRIHTGSLGPPIAVHAMNNLLALIFLGSL
jgi:membrane protease YdiL (CAAX protease family)